MRVPSIGLLVSFVILRQGVGLLGGAFRDLTDAGVSPETRQALIRSLQPLLPPSSPSHPRTVLLNGSLVHPLFGIRHLRAKRSGSLIFVDVTADVSGSLSIDDASLLDEKITETLKRTRREIAEVRVKFHPVDDSSG
jgi:divalent metal cation (Fe/Co/Zn/Cd) transporter